MSVPEALEVEDGSTQTVGSCKGRRLGSAVLATTVIFGAVVAFHSWLWRPRAPGRFLIISDVHLDLNWDPRLKPGYPCFCSRALNKSDGSCVTDMVVPWRESCNSPSELIDLAFRVAKKVIPNPDFILSTGDMVHHWAKRLRYRNTTEETFTHIVNVSHSLEVHFPGTAKLLAFGNNDLERNTYFVNISRGCDQPYFAQVSKVWSPLMGLDVVAENTLRCGGYFAYHMSKHLKIVVLNTNIYSAHKQMVEATQDFQDPLGQFEWLRQELLQARVAKEKVYIAGHIAPGRDLWSSEELWQEHYLESYLSLIRSFADVIAAQFFGHEHRAAFKQLPQEVGSLSPVILASAVTPLTPLMPKFQVMEYDTRTFELLDLITYTAPEESSMDLNWLEESFCKTYGLKSLSSQETGAFLRRMENDHEWLQKYFVHQITTVNCSLLEASCQARIWCTADAIRSLAYQDCVRTFGDRLAQASKWPGQTEMV